MTFIWLIVWLIQGTPALHQWNAWLVSLLICLALDIFGGSNRTVHHYHR